MKIEDAGHAHDKMARVLNANADALAEALVTREKEEFYNWGGARNLDLKVQAL